MLYARGFPPSRFRLHLNIARRRVVKRVRSALCIRVARKESGERSVVKKQRKDTSSRT